MSDPGTGGLQPPPLNAPGVQQLTPGVQPGVTGGIVIANTLIVFGAGGGIFTYNGAPALGNPPIFAVVAPGVTLDPYGNAVQTLMNLGNLAGAHVGFDAAGVEYLSDAAGVTRILIDPQNRVIEFYDASGTGANPAQITIASAAGNDRFTGDAFPQGLAVNATVSGQPFAVQLGLGSFAGTPAIGLFTQQTSSPPNSSPLLGAVEGSPAGCSAVVYSGKSLAGSTGAGIQATDSTGSGVAGGELDVIAGLCNIQQNAQVGGNLTVGGVLTITSANSLSTPDLNLNPPMGTLPHYVLPTDTNSGASWGIGERQFINNCVDAINTLVSELQNRGMMT